MSGGREGGLGRCLFSYFLRFRSYLFYNLNYWYQCLPESCVTIVAVDSEPNSNEGKNKMNKNLKISPWCTVACILLWEMCVARVGGHELWIWLWSLNRDKNHDSAISFLSYHAPPPPLFLSLPFPTPAPPLLIFNSHAGMHLLLTTFSSVCP